MWFESIYIVDGTLQMLRELNGKWLWNFGIRCNKNVHFV